MNKVKCYYCNTIINKNPSKISTKNFCNQKCPMLIRRNKLSSEADEITDKIFNIIYKSKMLNSIFTHNEYHSLQHFVEVLHLDIFTCSYLLKEILENFANTGVITQAEELRLACYHRGI